MSDEELMRRKEFFDKLIAKTEDYGVRLNNHSVSMLWSAWKREVWPELGGSRDE